MKRVRFCGALGGSVTIRQGETEEEAVRRAEQRLLKLLAEFTKNLSDDGQGVNVGLEIDPTSYE